MSETTDPMIAALLREREGYVVYGKTDRVKAVDAELARRGYKAEPKKAPPKKRAAPKRQNAASSKPAAKG